MALTLFQASKRVCNHVISVCVTKLSVVTKVSLLCGVSSQDTRGRNVFWIFYCELKSRYRCTGTITNILLCVCVCLCVCVWGSKGGENKDINIRPIRL